MKRLIKKLFIQMTLVILTSGAVFSQTTGEVTGELKRWHPITLGGLGDFSSQTINRFMG